MIKPFSSYRIIIEHYMEEGVEFEDAFSKAKVPLSLYNQIKSFFKDEKVKIKVISSITSKDEDKILCKYNIENDKYYIGFENFLYDERKWKRSIVENLSETSKKILEQCPDPIKNEEFQYKGLVIGHIQSGKTANMTAFIARAADYGYKFFIILAGRYNELRLQTQNRIDQDVTGKSEMQSLKCVKHEHEAKKTPWFRMTEANIKGDFDSGTVTLDLNPSTPKIAVIKKNIKIMEKFIKYLKSNSLLKNFPAIIIDDECDEASINTNYSQEDEDKDPSKTNALIREILHLFPKHTYIGFTATPFANVLIDMNNDDDLYPKNFIFSLDEPDEYFGPKKLFGSGMSFSTLLDEPSRDSELDVIRIIKEEEMNEMENIDDQIDPPDILFKSISAFVLSNCARMLRGQTENHYSMLIHPSHIKNIHEKYKKWVEEELDILKGVATYPKKFKGYLKKIKTYWEQDFFKVSENERVKSFSFNDIWKFSEKILNSIEVKVLNSDFDHVLEYEKDERRYIIIGGNKLSRGLTLEGLSISLYLRPEPKTGNKYDTLLQMGRWFGYRKGYHDLTRIFVTDQIAEDFSDLATVEIELREDIKKYSEKDITPKKIAPLIRCHPTMQVTSNLKMGAGEKINISLSGKTIQTIVFPLQDMIKLKENQKTIVAWLKAIGDYNKDWPLKEYYTWEKVSSNDILNLVANYHFGESPRQVNRKTITEYIRNQNSVDELIDWTVILPPGKKKGEAFSWISGVSTRKIVRRIDKRQRTQRTAIKVLTESAHIKAVDEKFLISSNPKKGALLIYIIDKNSYQGTDKSLFLDKTGEDVIGLAFIFPSSTSNKTAEYITQGD